MSKKELRHSDPKMPLAVSYLPWACMTLLPEWNAWGPGVVTGCTGMVVLLVMLLIAVKWRANPSWSSSPRKLWLSLCWAWRAR